MPAWDEAQIEDDWITQAHQSRENLSALARRDAAGVIDGVKGPQSDHQTLVEHWAWWEVDLGVEYPLDRVEIFNPRPNRDKGVEFKVTIAAAREEFQQVHYMRGPDWKPGPLVLKLDGRRARWVRVWAGGWKDRLALSEVEVYGVADPSDNLARRGRADQSSFRLHPRFPMPAAAGPAAKDGEGHAKPGAAAPEPDFRYPLLYVPVAETLARGRALADALAQQGVAADACRTALDAIARRAAHLPPDAPVQEQLPLYLGARRAVRTLAFANPLLAGCGRVVFLKRAPGSATSTGPQFNSEYLRPGGGIHMLEGLRSGAPSVRCLTSSFPPGNFVGLDLSRDATRLLFAFARHDPAAAERSHPMDKAARREESFYHLYEMEVATGRVRQLTRGKYDDLHGAYLPNGDIVFVSTRRASFIQAGHASAQATLTETYPDCYLRCGISQIHTLHRMAADGANLRTLSPTDTHEWYPTVNHDGRLLYARWDYVDRDARIAFGLWACNPDGTLPHIVYGNYTREPFCIYEARPVPGSQRLMCIGSAHHSNTGGPVLLLDPNREEDGPAALTNLTPETCMPESQGYPHTYSQAPWPLSEEFLLCAWSPRPLHICTATSPAKVNDLGLYLYDAFGNRELLHRDPAINSTTPIPLVARPAAPVRSELPLCTDPTPQGRFLVTDVQAGLTGVPSGAVKSLRLVAVPPKVVAGWGKPMVGLTSFDPGKFVLGTVPVEKDGSAYFVAPAGVTLWFQALAEDGRAIQTMRSATYLQGGETQSCVGCHERRTDAVPNAQVLAARHPPSKIRPDVEGSWPLRFDLLVQPTLDRLLAAKDPKLAGLDLTPTRDWKDPKAIKPGTGSGTAETYQWKTLISYGGDRSLFATIWRDVDATGFAPSRPGQCPATGAPLWDLLTAPQGLPLTADERARLALWMDTYAQFAGHFTLEQEAEIVKLKARWADLLEQAAAPAGAAARPPALPSGAAALRPPVAAEVR